MNLRWRQLLLATALCALCVTARAAELTVSAAASVSNAFRELAAQFESQHRRDKVLLNLAASDALLVQIAKGAPADVFASADQETMDRAQAQKLIASDTRRDFAGNRLVLITPAIGAAPNKPGLTAPLTRLADLTIPAFQRIAIGQPTGVPAGRYARSALQAAGIWNTVEAKLIFAQNVRQCLDYVARGEVDAGFVYATDAALQADRVKVAFTIATTTPIRYPIAMVASSANPELARRFIDFVASAAGQSVLAKFGFEKP